MSTLKEMREWFLNFINLPSKVSLPLIATVAILMLAYIVNHLRIEGQLRTISELQNEVKELRYESITTSSELMNMSKQSEVIRRVEAEGLELKELTEPPRILKK